jgi:hypothetical protein
MNTTKNIAVIAIHGVGDHKPFDMARDTGNLLGNLQDANGDPVYCAFGERFIRIPVEPVKIPNASYSGAANPNGTVNEKNSWGPLDAAVSDGVHQAGNTGSKQIDQLFMEGQLAKFVSRDPKACYNCLRLEGARMDAPGQTRKVHIYDMCWSDLSGVAEGAVSIFGELYQLLFHLTSVGVNNVKAARLAFLRNDKFKERWTWFDRFQTGAAATLAWPIALLPPRHPKKTLARPNTKPSRTRRQLSPTYKGISSILTE